MGAAVSVSIPSYRPDSIKGCKQAKKEATRGKKRIDQHPLYHLTAATLEYI